MPKQHADPDSAKSGSPAADGFPDAAAYQKREDEAAAGTAREPSSSYPVTTAEIAFGVIAVAAWLLFFTSGTVIGTADDREFLDSGDAESMVETLAALFTVLTCYTITNVAFLAGLAAVAGEFSSRSRVSSLASAWTPPAGAPQLRDVLACYSAAAMRGFVIYLMFIAGLLLVTTEAITTPDQGQYVRLAGTISVLSFVAGYDSEMFRRALDRVVSLMSQTQHSDRPKAP
ncbi:MAG: hypothetical protein WBC44_19280 [Planctomycetaceae bacterium]